jgi:hypothetical protein
MNLRVKPEVASESEETLYTLATRYYIENDGDVSAATNKLFRYLSGNKEYLRSIIASAIAVAAKESIGTKMRTERQGIYRAASAAGQNKEAFAAYVEGAKEVALMEVRIWGGKKLGDSTRDELFASADQYETHGNDLIHKANFHRAVGRLIPGNKIARDVLNETKLAKLWGAAA